MNKNTNSEQMKKCVGCLDEEGRMTDLLNSQKHITGVYNNFLCETETETVKSCLSGILMDEHKIQEEIFNKMQEKGWYQTEKAEEAKLMETKMKYASGASN